MTLYEIDAALMACIDPETGEIDADAWEALSLDREVKIENTALLIKDLLAEANMIKQEEDALAQHHRHQQSCDDEQYRMIYLKFHKITSENEDRPIVSQLCRRYKKLIAASAYTQ